MLKALTIIALTAAAQTTQPDTEGWTPIFNGRDLDGWTAKFAEHPLGENYKNTYRVEDGVLKVVYDEYDDFGGAFGHLFYEHPYSHYTLRLEYRFTGEQTPAAPGWAFRNSGVMIHGQDPKTMRLEQRFPISVEVQLLGGDGENERPTGNVCTPGTHIVLDGEVDRRHCINSVSKTYHGDEWIRLEIEVRGAELIRHVVDGVEVMKYAKPELDPDDTDAAAWIERRGGETTLDAGTISLQAESHPCEFRKIEIKPLDR